MKPENQKEISRKFFDFLILFIVCVAVFSFALYYDFTVGGSELKALRLQVQDMERTFDKYNDRLRVAETIQKDLTGARTSDRKLMASQRANTEGRLEKMYNIKDDDTTNIYIDIFRITKQSMIDQMSMLDSLSARKERLRQYEVFEVIP